MPETEYFIKTRATKQGSKSRISVQSTHEGLDLVRRGRYAFHCDAQKAFLVIREKFDPYEICELNMLPFHQTKLGGFVINKESPFRSILATKYVNQ